LRATWRFPLSKNTPSTCPLFRTEDYQSDDETGPDALDKDNKDAGQAEMTKL
jgi:hypothetical protein